MKILSRRKLSILLLMCFYLRSIGEHINSDASMIQQSYSNYPSITLPLKYSNGHLFVVLKEHLLGDISMEVDTGSEKTLIASSKTSNTIKINKRGLPTIKGYGDDAPIKPLGSIEIVLYKDRSSVFSGSAFVVDMRNKPEFSGVLGWDFFRQSCIRLNYEKKEMTVWPASQCKEPIEPHGTLQGDWSLEGLLLPATITFANGNNANAKLLLDTGSNGTLILPPHFRELAGTNKTVDSNATGSGYGIEGNFAGDVAHVSSLQVGGNGLKFNKVSMSILIRRSTGGMGRWLNFLSREPLILREGEIGNALLEHATLTFDPMKKLVYVELNHTSNF